MDGTPSLCSYQFFKEETGLFGGPHGGTYQNQQSFLDDLSGLCRYCKSPLKRATIQTGLDKLSHYNSLYQYNCANCGWWLVSHSRESDTRPYPIGHSHEIKITGEAKHYKLDSIAIPLIELRKHLSKKPHEVRYVNPTVFEKLMADCIRDSFGPCEIIHTGGSGDGGIDLKMILTEKETYLIQVKRRENLARSEGVQVVRELNGVLFREGLAKGLIVTTASKFTKAAFEETNIKNSSRDTYEMKLLAFQDLIKMLKIEFPDRYDPWAAHLERLKFNT